MSNKGFKYALQKYIDATVNEAKELQSGQQQKEATVAALTNLVSTESIEFTKVSKVKLLDSVTVSGQNPNESFQEDVLTALALVVETDHGPFAVTIEIVCEYDDYARPILDEHLTYTLSTPNMPSEAKSLTLDAIVSFCKKKASTHYDEWSTLAECLSKK